MSMLVFLKTKLGGAEQDTGEVVGVQLQSNLCAFEV